jgi:osmotically-inducible protein OsmY
MQARAAGADSANPDRLITSAVQSQIASDSVSQAANLAVTTINGVVILTGTVPNADAVEHVKQVVQQVKDVKGVDATAVRVSGS